MIITVHLRATSLQRPFFFGGVGVGGGGMDSPHVHSCSMATFFCPKVAVVKWFNCTSIIYYMTLWKALMQTNIYFQIKLAADKCYHEYSQRTHWYFRSSLLSTRPKLSNACESQPPNSFCYFSGWEKRRPDIRLRSLRTTNKAQCRLSSITFETFTLCILCASFLDLQWRFVRKHNNDYA